MTTRYDIGHRPPDPAKDEDDVWILDVVPQKHGRFVHYSDYEKLVTALQRIHDGITDCACEDHTDSDCCAQTSYFCCAFCVAGLALQEAGEEI